MKKEEYKLEHERLTNEIYAINSKKIDLEKKYIEANKTFSIGDRVYSKKEKSLGYVIGFKLNWKRDVIPECLKEKKDGKVSKVKLYVGTPEELVLSPKT